MALRMIFVGGFLGAGKTTLLAQAAGRLVRAGKRVGLVTNDQAKDLVDTGILTGGGFETQEVAGGCFCCRINDLLDVSNKLRDKIKPDVIIGEPVGSCTDLSATVINPLKALHPDEYTVAPFSVMTDPARLRASLAGEEEEGRKGGGEEGRTARPSSRPPLLPSSPPPVSATSGLPDSVVYIFRKQLEEADAIVLNKADLLTPAEMVELRGLIERHFPFRRVFTMSAAGGEGVDPWLDYVMTDSHSGTRIVPVDYKLYAQGEAELGWLNATADLRADGQIDWKAYCVSLLTVLQEEFRRQGAEVAHAKLLLTAPGCTLMANITDSQGVPAVRGACTAAARAAQLVVNARVRIAPADLQSTLTGCLRCVGAGAVHAAIRTIESFRPSPPTPVYRYKDVVKP